MYRLLFNLCPGPLLTPSSPSSVFAYAKVQTNQAQALTSMSNNTWRSDGGASASWPPSHRFVNCFVIGWLPAPAPTSTGTKALTFSNFNTTCLLLSTCSEYTEHQRSEAFGNKPRAENTVKFAIREAVPQHKQQMIVTRLFTIEKTSTYT